MKNQKKVNPMTDEQYFALRCEIIRRRDSAEIVFFVLMIVGMALIAIGEAMNKTSVNITGVVMMIFPIIFFFSYRGKTRNKLDDLRIKYSTGESFEYAAIKLGFLEEKIKEERFTPGACESQ